MQWQDLSTVLTKTWMSWCSWLLVGLVPAVAQVQTGIDVLLASNMDALASKRIVVVTHAAARASTGRSTAEELLKHPRVRVLRLLAPEHGYFGVVRAGDHVSDDIVGTTPVVSLYGRLRRPEASMITDADAVVIDLQDIGTRSYTYISTTIEVMEACAQYRIPVMILDRPNPLGDVVDGAIPDPSVRNFVCRIPVPYVHGMTMGELATMANDEGWLERDASGTPRRCSLTVIRCAGWSRSMRWEDTGLAWYPTSPNIPSITTVRGYPTTGLLGELGLASIGIGTSSPFTMVGTPTYAPTSRDEEHLMASLRGCGVIARDGRFVPIAGKFAKQECRGYQLVFAEDSTLKPFRAALILLHHFRAMTPTALDASIRSTNPGQMFVKTSGSQRWLDRLLKGATLSELCADSDAGVREFLIRRLPYLLY